MTDAILAPLLQWGAPGTIIIALGWAYWKRVERVDAINEKRIEESRETLNAINSNTTALNALADLVKARRGDG